MNGLPELVMVLGGLGYLWTVSKFLKTYLAVLLFSYPVSREKILTAKILFVCLYTFFATVISGMAVLFIFMLTESMFPLCSTDVISMGLIFRGVLTVVFCGLVSVCCGVISLWFGFWKKSIITTIVASCIIMVVICQIAAMSLYSAMQIIILLTAVFFALFAVKSLIGQVRKMEI